MMNSSTILRKDIQVTNDRGNQLECTYFLPDNMIKQKDLPFVIYLHGNSGSRVEAVSTLQHLAPNFGLFCFDFSGSGKSQGKYVTMGVNECKDLECIVDYVRLNLCQSEIIIWGRSMGAVTGILYAYNHSSIIQGLVLDSPFSDLKKVMQEIASSKTKIPSLIVDGAISLVKSKIQETLNGVDIFNTQIEEKVKEIHCPVLFTYGTKDTIILPYHSQTLYKACKSQQKFIVEFEGNHNTIRPLHFFNKIIIFIKQNCMMKKLIQQLKGQQPHDIQKNIHQKDKLSVDVTQIVKQQQISQEVSPIIKIKNHNILQSLPSEERRNIKEQNKESNQLYKSPLLHQNFREKDQLETKKLQLTESQNDQFLNNDFTPNSQNKKNQLLAHHEKQSSFQEQSQRGISLLSNKEDYKQTNKQNTRYQKNNKQQIKQNLEEFNQQSVSLVNQIQLPQQIQKYTEQQHQQNKQQHQRKQNASKPRKKIFQDNNSGIKQSSNSKGQIDMRQQRLQLSNNMNEQEILIDQADQYIQNQINLLQDIAIDNSNNLDKSPHEQSSYINKPTNFPFAKSPSAAVLSPSSQMNFFNINNGVNQNSNLPVVQAKPHSGSDYIKQKDIQVTPFMIENNFANENTLYKQNQNIQLYNNVRQNNFVDRQNLQQEKVKKSSNPIQRQYSLDNNIQYNINGKHLTINNPYGNQIYRSVSKQCNSPTNIQILQQQTEQNYQNDQNQKQQYYSIERQIQMHSQQSVKKLDNHNTSDYQQIYSNSQNIADKNNSSFDQMNNSYLNPTKNPFSFNQQKVTTQLNMLQNNEKNNNNANVLIQPLQNIQQITRNRHQSLTTSHISHSNNQESSLQRQQLISETQSGIRTLPNTHISYVLIPQQIYKDQQINQANNYITPQISINDINIREKQTLSPVNRQLITPKITSQQTPQQVQSVQKCFGGFSNMIQPMLYQQNSHTPLSSFPIVLNQVQQIQQPFDNIQRRFSGVENNDQVQFVSILTQNQQNRTLREINFNSESQRGQFKFQDKRYPQYNENRNVKHKQQSSSLFEKVLSELQNKPKQLYNPEQLNLGNQTKIQDSQTFKNNSMYNQIQINQYSEYNSTHNNSKQYQSNKSESVTEKFAPNNEQNSNYQSSQYQEFDKFLPITNQIYNNNGQQIELHTNLSFDDNLMQQID